MRRFIIRDEKTKKIIKNSHTTLDFNSLNAAKIYMSSTPFGASNFWEVYDSEEEEVVFSYIRHYNMGKNDKGYRPYINLRCF